MEADLSQIKLLLWAILALQLFFVVANILCRVLHCGERKEPNYGDLLKRGKVQEVLDQTKRRLETHPRDTSALYFRTKALIDSGLTESARSHISQLMIAEPSLIPACKDWLEALDSEPGSDA